MKYEMSSNIIYQYTADRLKRRREVLKLTNDVIARKKIFVHYEAYIDYATDEDEPERFETEPNPVKSKFDSSMISRILNNERGKIGNRNSPNPYLIPPTYEDLLVEQLQFEDKKELFWGSAIELEYIVKTFYKILFEEVLENDDSELRGLLNLYLTDYVPYSKNFTYYQMIVEKCLEQCDVLSEHFHSVGKDISQSKLWNIFITLLENDFEKLLENFYKRDPLVVTMCSTIGYIMDMIGEEEESSDIYSLLTSFQLLKNDWFKEEAIGRIIFLNFEDLFQLYQEYFCKQTNFKFLNKKIAEFVSDVLTPYFKELLGNPEEFKVYSLGYRVRNIINTDIDSIFSYTSRITQEKYDDVTNQNSNMYKKLLQTTLTYIKDLKYMQWLTDRERVEITTQEDIERLYLQSSNIERLKDGWFEKYSEYLSNNHLDKFGEYMEADEYEELLIENSLDDLK